MKFKHYKKNLRVKRHAIWQVPVHRHLPPLVRRYIYLGEGNQSTKIEEITE